ncbi:bacterial transcription activator [Paenibacillus sp. 32O-W]|uniref:GyrI-like domain-containing protein n=1 Tax=Paenibacillus sp. 32O-W TaxID=1695218 RepID=UPI00072136A0|nr:GyrI-like domain-containing protein [Paenibacillus sp. 32O-W]ALS28612.1 bacterial transcription activator [Paenibacillus sp. 32O-W]
MTTAVLPEMTPVIVEHDELKLIGIPCVGLKTMKSKYENAKEGLLAVSGYLPQVVNPRVLYGMWPNAESQNNPDTHVYILCLEVSTFDGIPPWFVRLTVPPQKCVVAANGSGNYDAASKAVEDYIRENRIAFDRTPRDYVICERYHLDGEGFAKYSLPIE